MNRRDLLKGALAGGALGLLGTRRAEALTTTRDPAPLYTIGKYARPSEPVDYNLVEVGQDMIRRARNKLGLRSGPISVHVLNCTFHETSLIADAAIAFNCDANFKRRPEKGLTKAVIVEARSAMVDSKQAWFDTVFSEEIRIYADGRRVHLINVRDRFGNEIKK